MFLQGLSQSTQTQHVGVKLLLFVIIECVAANKLSVCSSTHSKLCKAQYSLWLGIPFGFTRHGEVLVERECNERAGRLICDGGQLFNWATNKQTSMEI